MTRLLRALLPALVVGFVLPSSVTTAQQSCMKPPTPAERAELLKMGYTEEELAKEFGKGCDTVAAARSAYEEKEKARQDSIERLEAAQHRFDEEKRERLGRWLWAVPLSVLALVVLVAVRGEPVKAWIGRLHGGQVFILASSLLVGGFCPLVAAAFFGSLRAGWPAGFVPVGAVSAVLVLWFWFGARATPKGDA